MSPSQAKVNHRHCTGEGDVHYEYSGQLVLSFYRNKLVQGGSKYISLVIMYAKLQAYFG